MFFLIKADEVKLHASSSFSANVMKHPLCFIFQLDTFRYIWSVFEGVTDARLDNIKFTEAFHSISALYLGSTIFFYDAKFVTDRHSV